MSAETFLNTTFNPIGLRGPNVLINKKALRQLALEIAQDRAHKFTRVGNDFYAVMEATLKSAVRSYVSKLPSKGKTI